MIGLPIPSTPMVDPLTGVVTQVWYEFLSNVLTRIGGPTRDVGGDALAQSLYGALGDPADLVDLSGVQGTADGAMTLGMLGETVDLPDVSGVQGVADAAMALALIGDPPDLPDLSGVQGTADVAMTMALLGDPGDPVSIPDAAVLLGFEPPDEPDPATAALLAMALADLF